MKILNKKIIITALISLFVGFGLAYIFIPNKSTEKNSADLVHEHLESENEGQIWTCSMHPQIRQEEEGDCPICGMDLIPLSKNSSTDPLVLEMTEEAAKLANIQTTVLAANSGGNHKTIRLSGKIQEDERLASSQVAHVPGRIEKLFVSFTGEQVYKGQKLAELYSPELINAQQELIQALDLIEISPGLVDAARNKLKYLKVDPSFIEEIESSRKIKETFPLFADVSGIVSKKRVSVGDYIKQGEVMFDLMDLKRVWVLFDVYEDDLPFIRIGDKIEFTTPSLPSKQFAAKINFIDPVINPNSRTVSIRTEINNNRGQLKPEMLVYGELENRSSRNNQVKVPKSAVLWTGPRSVVYVKIPDMAIPSFKFREIELGESLGDSYLVLNGLEQGEEVVTYGNFAIDAAAQLNNQNSMMNKRVNIAGIKANVKLADFTNTTPVAFKEQLYDLTAAYLALKDALVESDVSLAMGNAKVLIEKLEVVDMSLLKGESHFYWMDQLKAIKAHTIKIVGLSDLEEQRKQFDFLSQALIKTIKAFGIPKDRFYVQHCPMAFGKKGADWISDVIEIRNPYFGDQMLKCGSIEDTITKDYKNPVNNSNNIKSSGSHNHS